MRNAQDINRSLLTKHRHRSERLSLSERSNLRHSIGLRPQMVLTLQDGWVQEIWVNGRAPIISLHDYDWAETDPLALRDADGHAFSCLNWSSPAWRLGLTVNPL